MSEVNRREVLSALVGSGILAAVCRQATLASPSDDTAPPRVTAEMIRQAEWLAGLSLRDAQREEIVAAVNQAMRSCAAMREFPLDNSVAPALSFFPAAPMAAPPSPRGTTIVPPPSNPLPSAEDDIAFAGIPTLRTLLDRKKISAVELTKLYLARLKKFDEKLLCVVTLTEEHALRRAAEVDRELAAGSKRGPLHGIPYGLKDLIAYPGYPTTWCAPQYKARTIDTKATVAKKLDDAGAILVAKLSLGALAMGDQWYRGLTRNPWNPKLGSSGSSAGSAAAVAAGLVPFAIGSETLGSIVSPCRQCGATGLRPTFGRVSRFGCMALAWSMDKIGPIARSVIDCALVFDAIHGADGLDHTAVERPFPMWPTRPLREIRVGYFESFADRPELKTLQELGVPTVPIALPQKLPPVVPLRHILEVEAASAFDDLVRSGATEALNDWPRIFRAGEFFTAVEYLRAQRLRSLLIERYNTLFEKVDLYIGGNDLLICNLTGHPTVVMPHGFRKVNGLDQPNSLTFTGRLYGEAELLTVASAFQETGDSHRKRPPL